MCQNNNKNRTSNKNIKIEYQKIIILDKNFLKNIGKLIIYKVIK